MSVTPLELPGPWTLEDLDPYEDELHRYEIVDGALVVNPPPTNFHQGVGRMIFRALDRQAPPRWEAAYETTVRLPSSARVPDVALLRVGTPALRGALGYEPSAFGLVVEVVSPSTKSTDRILKPAEYAAAGIPWFWRVETDPVVELFAFELVDGAYVERARLAGTGVVPGPFPVSLDLSGF
jgi:Uma2 family endonuclease